MARPKRSYDSKWRLEKWKKVPKDKKSEWENKMKDLFWTHRKLSMSKLSRLMGMAKWRTIMVLTPLIDKAKVYVIEEDDRGLPTLLQYWEDYATEEVS
jgi:hypothetical protein